MPYLLFRYLRDYAPNNPIHTHVQGVLFLTKNFYVMNPLTFFGAAGPLGALALVSVFVLWRRARVERTSRLLLHGIVAVYLLLFIPLWYPFLLEKMSYLLLRFEFAVPSMLVCAYLLGELWKKLRGRNPELGRFPAVVGIAAAAVLLVPPLVKTSSGFAYGGAVSSRLRAKGFRNLGDSSSSSIGIVPGEASSRRTRSRASAYRPSPTPSRSVPSISTPLRTTRPPRERISDCRKLFSLDVSMTEIRTSSTSTARNISS